MAQDRRNSSGSKHPNKGKQKLAQQVPWLCLSCENAIEDGQGEVTIQCFLCKEFCHKQCCGHTVAQFNACRSTNFLQWTCDGCSDKEVFVKSQIEAKLDGIFQLLKVMTERLEYLEKNDKVTKIEETIENKVQEYMQDKEERDKRKLNIIVVNIPESEKESAEERKKDDRDKVRECLSKIPDVNVEEIDNPVRLGAFRIGNNVRPRLLRMEVKTEATKKKVMKGIYNLNANKRQDQRIFINNDSTPKEREKIKQLRDEVKLRTESGEVNLAVDYRVLKIVTRQPRPVGAAEAPQVPADH